jgi:hypothetical protein
MKENRFDREFGTGTFLGDSGDRFYKRPMSYKVVSMGWSHACPVINDVVKEFGPEWTLKRYSECNFVFGIVAEAAKKFNPDLHKLLTSPVPRIKSEVPGKGHFHPRFVPKSFNEEMFPLSTPWGFAIPRVIIEEMGRGKDNADRTQKRILKAMNLIDKTVKSSKSPIELLVKLSESVSKIDADPKTVLSHVLSEDILNEEGCKNIFGFIKQTIDSSAPILRKTYESMSPQERSERRIINF